MTFQHRNPLGNLMNLPDSDVLEQGKDFAKTKPISVPVATESLQPAVKDRVARDERFPAGRWLSAAFRLEEKEHYKEESEVRIDLDFGRVGKENENWEFAREREIERNAEALNNFAGELSPPESSALEFEFQSQLAADYSDCT